MSLSNLPLNKAVPVLLVVVAIILLAIIYCLKINYFFLETLMNNNISEKFPI